MYDLRMGEGRKQLLGGITIVKFELGGSDHYYSELARCFSTT